MDICFLAIVRDEAPVIERCLTSVKEMISSYLIFDTGSKDDTISIIQKTMAGIPGEVLSREWISYGETKSELLREFKDHPLVGRSKYICWLDADEVFITNKNDPLSYPTKDDAVKLYEYLESTPGDVFMVTTLYDHIEYQRWQIARNNQLYKWRLPYQEYFVGTESNIMVNIPLQLYNLARHEGNSSRDPEITKKRIEMAERWLEDQGVEDEGYPRMIFYLAEAYQSIDVKRSMELYEKRVLLKGYEEERYESLLKLGKLTDRDDLRLYFLTAAQDINPLRLEAYYDHFMYYFNKGEHRKAIGIYQMAPESRMPPPGLFIIREVYDYLFDLNASFSYFRLGKYKKAYKLGRKLLSSKIPDKNRPIAENNIKHYEKFYNPEQVSSRVYSELANLLVIDNFYDNPHDVRDKALSMDFGIKGNYPGGRTQPTATEEMKARFENIIGKKITYWPEQYNGSFQFTTKDHKSWIHRDNTDYSVVIYLTPNAPSNGGTVLYRHLSTGKEHNLDKNPETEKMLDNDGADESKWEVIDRIGNKFNRAIIFQGKYNHKSDHYFGDCLENGRLFQTFFFNVS